MKISKEEYAKLKGLFALAEEYKSKIDDCEKAVAQTLGIERDRYGDYGPVGDAFYGDDFDLDSLLRSENIEIED